MAHTLRVVAQEAKWGIAVFGPVLVNVVKGGITLEFLDAVQRAGNEILKDHPNHYCSLSITLKGSAIPDSATRARAAKMQKEDDGKSKAGAVVLEGTGFWASTQRSAMAALTLLSPPRFPQKVFATTEEAGQWLQPYAGLLEFRALVAAAGEFRARYENDVSLNSKR